MKALTTKNKDITESKCPVCGTAFGDAPLALCAKCETVHHLDCWHYDVGCARYGCGSKAFVQKGLSADSSRRIVTYSRVIEPFSIRGCYSFALFIFAGAGLLAFLMLLVTTIAGAGAERYLIQGFSIVLLAIMMLLQKRVTIDLQSGMLTWAYCLYTVALHSDRPLASAADISAVCHHIEKGFFVGKSDVSIKMKDGSQHYLLEIKDEENESLGRSLVYAKRLAKTLGVPLVGEAEAKDVQAIEGAVNEEAETVSVGDENSLPWGSSYVTIVMLWMFRCIAQSYFMLFVLTFLVSSISFSVDQLMFFSIACLFTGAILESGVKLKTFASVDDLTIAKKLSFCGLDLRSETIVTKENANYFEVFALPDEKTSFLFVVTTKGHRKLVLDGRFKNLTYDGTLGFAKKYALLFSVPLVIHNDPAALFQLVDEKVEIKKTVQEQPWSETLKGCWSKPLAGCSHCGEDSKRECFVRCVNCQAHSHKDCWTKAQKCAKCESTVALADYLPANKWQGQFAAAVVDISPREQWIPHVCSVLICICALVSSNLGWPVSWLTFLLPTLVGVYFWRSKRYVYEPESKTVWMELAWPYYSPEWAKWRVFGIDDVESLEKELISPGAVDERFILRVVLKDGRKIVLTDTLCIFKPLFEAYSARVAGYLDKTIQVIEPVTNLSAKTPQIGDGTEKEAD